MNIFSAFKGIFASNNPSSSGTVQTVSSVGFSSVSPAAGNAGNWFNQTVTSQVKDKITVYSPDGSPLELLSSNITASGGEGNIYTLPGKDHILIKIYKDTVFNDAEKLDQIRKRIIAMFKLKGELGLDRKNNRAFLAWPLMPVFDSQKQIIGFAMQKCSGTSFRALGSIDSIRRYFPGWSRMELVKTAQDFIRKVYWLHQHGVQINDFNPSNFLVDANGNVSFIDCDSFQITSGGKTHITRTYISSHCAPELLKDKRLLAQPRNLHHLEFGAAVIVFNLLMGGLHPYSYYDPARQMGCGNPEENLINGRCPLGTGAGCKFPAGNWYNLWSWIPHNTKSAFINTFRSDMGHRHPEKRTSLADWNRCLDEMLFFMRKYPNRSELFPLSPNQAAVKSKNPPSGKNIPINF